MSRVFGLAGSAAPPQRFSDPFLGLDGRGLHRRLARVAGVPAAEGHHAGHRTPRGRFPHTEGPPESPRGGRDTAEWTRGQGPPPQPWGTSRLLSVNILPAPAAPRSRARGEQSFVALGAPQNHLAGGRAAALPLGADHGGADFAVPEAAAGAFLRVHHRHLQLLQGGRRFPTLGLHDPGVSREAAPLPRWRIPSRQRDRPPCLAQCPLPVQLRAGGGVTAPHHGQRGWQGAPQNREGWGVKGEHPNAAPPQGPRLEGERGGDTQV